MVLAAKILTGLVLILGAVNPGLAVTATPATFQQVLLDAKSGDAIRLAPGDYDAVMVKQRQWSPAVTIDATGARIRAVKLFEVSGLTWHGGFFDGGGVERSGVSVNVGSHLIVDGTTMSHYLRNGIGIGKVSDARLTNNAFTDMGSDGIDVALSRRVVIDHNHCEDSHPTPGAHPDCVQLWSRPTDPPEADITITNNVAIGATQGFTGFNHIRQDADGKPVDDGGFDRIVVENNTAKVSFHHAISFYDCRDCVIRNNHVETLPNPDNPRVRAWIKVVNGTNVIACGNTVASFPGGPEARRCK